VDTSVSPGDDFFKYAVGKWIKDNPIPSNERSWGIYNAIQEETYQRLLKINESAAAGPQAVRGSNAQKIGDFWYSAMDTASIEKLGITPLKEEFQRIDAVHDMESLLSAMARLQYIGARPGLGMYIFQDEKDSNKFALHLYQGGIGLPDRDYYFDEDDRTKNIRAEHSNT
jgi:putative endopeptidase